jgi:hypothetical protein
MKTKLLAMMLLAGGSMFAQTRFSVGVGVAGPNAGYYAAIPPSPGPGYVWIEGFWSQNYGQSVWVPGYWSLQPYYGGYGSSYYGGYNSGYYGGGYGTYYGSSFRGAERRFEGRDDRRGSNFGFEQNRNRGVEQSRSFSSGNRGSNQVQQPRSSVQNQNQNQNRGNGNRSSGQNGRSRGR